LLQLLLLACGTLLASLTRTSGRIEALLALAQRLPLVHELCHEQSGKIA
jgi:hypothetical protein